MVSSTDFFFFFIFWLHNSTYKYLYRIGGNRFDKGINYPSWNFPLENIPNEQNTSITSPPSTESSAIESYPSSHKEGEKKKKEMGPGGIALMICGGTLVAFCAALVIVIHIHRSRALKLKRLENSEASRYSLPISTARGENCINVGK